MTGVQKINGLRWGTTSGDKVRYSRTGSSVPTLLSYGGNEYGESSD